MIVSPRGRRLLCITGAVGVVAIATFAIVDHLRLTHLTRTTPGYASHSDVRALQQRLDTFDVALTRLQHAPSGVAQATFDATRQAFDARVSKLEQLSTTTATADALNALDARMGVLETRLRSATQTASKAANARRHPVTSPPPLPPFAILGEEQRGGQTFLVIAPPHWQALSDVRLLQPGDLEGEWQLDALDGDSAIFRIDGQTRRLSIR